MTSRTGCIQYAPAPRRVRHRRAAALFAGLLTRIAEWQARAEQRAHLAGMDARMLKDIGISHVDAAQEADKPFWKA